MVAKQAYEYGDYVQAQCGLAKLYESGKLERQNIEKAIEWFSLSADQKYALGGHGLALVFATNSWKGQDTHLVFDC